MRILLLLNAEAGAASKMGGEACAHDLAARFVRRGVDVHWIATSGSKVAERLRQAIEADKSFDVVVAGGGDGTVSAVAGVLAGTERPMAVLPLGTLNHFARDLGMPADLDEAIAVIAAGHRRRVDVAAVNGHIFLNNSSIGFYPRMVIARSRSWRIPRAKWLATAVATLRTLYRLPRRRLRVRVKGEERMFRTGFVLVSNNRYELALRDLGSRAALDRGELCLYLIRDDRPWQLLQLALRLLIGRVDRAEELRLFCGLTKIEIDAHIRRLAVAADGQVVMLRPPLHYHIHPGALQVIAPRPA